MSTSLEGIRMEAPAGEALRTEAAALAQLDRHEGRRAGRVPVVSALVGPVEPAAALGRRWAEARGRSVVELPERELTGAAAAWVERLARDRDLRGDALAWLARQVGRDEGELGPRLLRMTGHERALWLERVLPPGPGEAAAACRWLLEQAGSFAPGALAAGLVERLATGAAEGHARVFTALRRLVGAGRDPVLLVRVSGDDPGADPAARVGAAARRLAGLAEAEPGLALVLVVAQADFDDYQRLAPDDRVKALLRGSVVAVPASDPWLGDPPVPPATAPSDPDPDPDDEARSAAERFLFERLEAHPETAGLFQLNADPGLRFGADRAMEVDLLASSLRLAVEIDGYHHFHDPDAYRRDRRKDLLLQTGGFLVVRVLADDVAARLEDVLATIVAAVASRRGPGETKTQGDPSA
jgi:hypothetical protein